MPHDRFRAAEISVYDNHIGEILRSAAILQPSRKPRAITFR